VLPRAHVVGLDHLFFVVAAPKANLPPRGHHLFFQMALLKHH
jgi:hypothetical protein